jgi:hypoxanthine phosphoribosyltransferase
MIQDVQNVLLSQWQINARVAEMARTITSDHSKAHGSEPITLLPIMTGAMIFAGDLIRQIPIRMQIELLTISSYPATATQSQGASLVSRMPKVEGRHVLVVDDILDSGGTLALVKPMLLKAGAASVKTCVLLKKIHGKTHATQADYVGFEIPDAFVVGYGLDFNNYYRNLPDIVTLTPDAIQRASAHG